MVCELLCLFLVVLCYQFNLERGQLVCLVLLSLEQDYLLFSYLIYKAFAVVLDVALLEAVAMTALRMAIEFGEAEAHV